MSVLCRKYVELIHSFISCCCIYNYLFLALFRRNFNEKIPRTNVCQNHPLAFWGSTLLANLQAYTDSPTCIATAQIANSLNTHMDRRTIRHPLLSSGTGNAAAIITADIPNTQKNHS
ncbi:hypothetical protein Hanom_Chr15g01414781 [Helianthus anomalus]